MIQAKKADPAAEQWQLVFDAVFDFQGLPRLSPHLTLRARTFYTDTPEFKRAVLIRCEPRGAKVPFGEYLFRRWDMVGNHGSTADWGVRTCTGRFSVQMVWHAVSLLDATGVVECDVDLYNPDAGAYYAIQHGIHDVALKRSSDPWRMARGLEKTWPGLVVPRINKDEGSTLQS